MKKIRFVGLPAVALVIIMVLTGCPDSNLEEKDPWTEVTNVNALAGNWSGSGTITIPAQSVPISEEEDDPGLSISAFSLGLELSISYVADAPTAKTSTKTNMGEFFDAMAKTVNSNPEIKSLMALGVILTVAMDEELTDAQKIAALSGLGISLADSALLMSGDEDAAAAVLAKASITKDHLWNMLAAGMGPDAQPYYYTENATIPAEELIGKTGGETGYEKIYIHQDGTKIKLVIPKESFGGMDMNIAIADDVALLLNKQN